MRTKEQELVLTNGHKDSLLQEDSGDFKYKASELKEVVDMDNRYPKEAGSDVKISSDIICNKLGGIQSIADGLQTNLKTGISGTKQDLAER